MSDTAQPLHAPARPARRLGAALGLAAALLAQAQPQPPVSPVTPVAPASPAAASLPERPTIRISVDVRSESLRRTLGAGRGAAEQQLAGALADLLQQRHPFVAWAAAAGAAPPIGTTMGMLLAAVVDRGSVGGGSPVALAWSLALGAGEQALKLQEVPIYAPFDNRGSAHEPRLFADHVRDKLRAVVHTEGFDRQAFEHLLSQLPIARAVEALADDRLVLIPLRWEHLRLGAGSRLEVQVLQAAADGERRNRAVLSFVQERRRGEPRQRGLVQASVAELVADSLPMPLDGRWHPRLPELLRGKEVLCYLKHFEPEGLGSGGQPAMRLDP